MDRDTRTTARAPKLVFGEAVPCPECRNGKLRSRWDAKAGRWYQPKCGYCRGMGIVSAEAARTVSRD